MGDTVKVIQIALTPNELELIIFAIASLLAVLDDEAILREPEQNERALRLLGRIGKVYADLETMPWGA